MKNPTLAGVVLGFLGLFGALQAQAQHAGGDQHFAATDLRAQVRCPEVPVDVIAASVDERRLVCSAVSEALQLLRHCEIFPRRPLVIQITDEVRHPFGRVIFGLFDPRDERIWITQFGTISSLVRGTPFSELPQRELYKSIVVHELVHGVMHQNAKRRAITRSAYEYPAYALQIASLTSSARDRFLQTIHNVASTGDFVFNDFILSMDPFFFAASAYEHFSASANGCAHLIALLEGEAAFISEVPSLP